MAASAIHVCIGGRVLRTNLAAFTSKAQADSWAAAANIWYGQGHPLHPVEVEALALDPTEYPTMALARLQALPQDAPGEEVDAALTAIFEDIDR